MPTNDSYTVIEHPGQAKVTEKMSRFLAFAHTAESEQEAKDIINSYRNKYHDARHVCWAYMLGPERLVWQLNDNGEPSGTAGKPILGQINSLGLTDVVVVVVRYFGGITWGTSGLIAAYRQAAREALEDAGAVVKRRMVDLNITFPYLAMNDVMKTVKAENITVVSQNFDNSCLMHLQIPADDHPRISRRLLDIDGVSSPEVTC